MQKLPRKENRPASSRLWEDVRWGATAGSIGGLLFTFVSVAFTLMRGVVLGSNDLILLVVLLLGGGTIAGVVVGLLKPLTRSRLGAAAVGAVSALPLVAGAFAVFREPISEWDLADVISIAFAAFVVGGLLGWQWWKLGGSGPGR